MKAERFDPIGLIDTREVLGLAIYRALIGEDAHRRILGTFNPLERYIGLAVPAIEPKLASTPRGSLVEPSGIPSILKEICRVHGPIQAICGGGCYQGVLLVFQCNPLAVIGS